MEATSVHTSLSRTPSGKLLGPALRYQAHAWSNRTCSAAWNGGGAVSASAQRRLLPNIPLSCWAAAAAVSWTFISWAFTRQLEENHMPNALQLTEGSVGQLGAQLCLALGLALASQSQEFLMCRTLLATTGVRKQSRAPRHNVLWRKVTLQVFLTPFHDF